MKLTFSTALLFLLFSFSQVFGQLYHTVTEKETFYGISKSYGLSLEELYQTNPRLKEAGLKVGDVLIIPERKGEDLLTKNASTPALGKVEIQPKQTLYSISRQYRISVDEIKRLNPNRSEELKIGDLLSLPLSSVERYGGDISSNKELPSANSNGAKAKGARLYGERGSQESSQYIVQKRDTYYGITRRFHLSQEELFSLNQGLREKGLFPGDTLNVQGLALKKNTDPSHEKKENFEKSPPPSVGADESYIVQDGDSVFSILNKLGIKIDQLLGANPQLAGGLIPGMLLKIRPSGPIRETKGSSEVPLDIALLLPFGLDSGDESYREISLDFLKGAQLAAERNTLEGKRINMHILDWKGVEHFRNEVSEIHQVDFVIGPLFKKDLLSLLNDKGGRDLTVISPFANSPDLHKYHNLIITNPSPSTYIEKIAEEISKTYRGEKIYIVSDYKGVNSELIAEELRRKIESPKIYTLRSPSDIRLDENIVTGKKVAAIFVLAHDREEVARDFSDRLIELSDQVDGIKAFSLSYFPVFDEREKGLKRSNLVYIAEKKVDVGGEFEKSVLDDFERKYCKSPSKYAILGFDIANHFLAIGNKGSLSERMSRERTGLAMKFEFEKTEGAYLNKACRVIRLKP